MIQSLAPHRGRCPIDSVGTDTVLRSIASPRLFAVIQSLLLKYTLLLVHYRRSRRPHHQASRSLPTCTPCMPDFEQPSYFARQLRKVLELNRSCHSTKQKGATWTSALGQRIQIVQEIILKIYSNKKKKLKSLIQYQCYRIIILK